MLTASDALTILLTTESLLFAALGIAANFAVPTKNRVPNPLISGAVLVGVAVFLLLVVAIGAFFAWAHIHYPTGIYGAVIQGVLAVAIGAQPVLAFFLAFCLRTKP